MLLIGIPDNQRAASAPAEIEDIPIGNPATQKRTSNCGFRLLNWQTCAFGYVDRRAKSIDIDRARL
jgi:hypothetical protein